MTKIAENIGSIGAGSTGTVIKGSPDDKIIERLLIGRYEPKTRSYRCHVNYEDGTVGYIYVKRSALHGVYSQLSDIEQEGVPGE